MEWLSHTHQDQEVVLIIVLTQVIHFSRITRMQTCWRIKYMLSSVTVERA